MRGGDGVGDPEVDLLGRAAPPAKLFAFELDARTNLKVKLAKTMKMSKIKAMKLCTRLVPGGARRG